MLRTYGSTSVNNRDPLAELLVRHGRIDALRTYAADEDRPEAVRHLAELLEARDWNGRGPCARFAPWCCAWRE